MSARLRKANGRNEKEIRKSVWCGFRSWYGLKKVFGLQEMGVERDSVDRARKDQREASDKVGGRPGWRVGAVENGGARSTDAYWWA